MAKADWENLVPGGKAGTTTDYVSPNAPKNTEEDDLSNAMNLRGKVEIKKKSWLDRTFYNFKRNWPKMLFGVAIPEMGKILVTKTFDMLYSTLFDEPYSGGASRGNGYFFKNNRVFDYSEIYGGAKKQDKSYYDGPSRKIAYDEFIFTSRLDVEEIIGKMLKQAREEGKVSVSDLYSIIRRTLKKNDYPMEYIEMLEKDQYTNNNYGWFYEDLRNVRPGIVGRDRYFLDLPEAVAIK